VVVMSKGAIFNLNEDGAPGLDRFLGHFTKPSGT